MATMIRPNRLEVSDRFPVAGFTVKTGNYPWFEVALATEPALFRAERKSQRTYSNFYSSRAMGPLSAERGEAVYLVPPEVLKRFAGQPKLYFGLATFPDANRSRAEVLQVPSEGSPWLNLKLFTGRGSRRMMALPHPRNGHARNGNGYTAMNPEELIWAGDAAQPGTEAIATSPPANGSTPAPASPAPSSPSIPLNTSASAALGYDDGFGPMPFETMAESENVEDYGIDEPIPDEGQLATGQSYSRAFTVSEYPQANRFVPAATVNYRTPSSPRTIQRIVIHITDGGPNINGTISWFQNPNQQNSKGQTIRASAHYIVGRDGEVVQMVRHSDIAFHAHTANSDSIGIEHVANTRGLNPTEAQYCNSAALVRWLSEQYNIPIDRAHIQGHSEADPTTTHTACPNAVWDWEYFMGMVTSASCYPRSALASSGQSYRSHNAQGFTAPTSRMTHATPLSTDIPLDPGNGGQSIGVDALAVGDIIVATTDHKSSEWIRFATGAPVSHAMIYTGDGGQVVEAVREGVLFRPLSEALADATVAVAFRHPNVTPERALMIRDFVGQQIGRNYNYWGIIRQAGFQLDRRVFCSGKTGEEYQRCVNWVGRVNLGTGTNDEFFCSQLVLAAYEHAGVPLTSTPPHWNSPGDIADLRLSGMLGYVGHLVAPPLGTSQGLRATNFGARGNGHGNGYGQSYGAPRSRAFSGQSFDVDWKEDIYLVPQLTGMSCWAAAAAMVVGWRDLMSINPEEIARGAGQWAAYTRGLNVNNVDELAQAWGLQKEWPQSYTIEGFWQLLENNGPLWIGVAAPSGHAVVATGLYGDGTPEGTFVRYNDPWPVGQGRERQIKNYRQFMQEYENFASTDTAGNSNIQIIHANGRRPISTSQGYATGYSGRATKPSANRRSRAFSDGAATNGAIFLKEADYSEEIGAAADPEQDATASGEKAALTNEEIYRIIREVATADSGDALYSAVSIDQASQFGLAFGLVLFTQHSGRLGRVLQLMQGRDAATFAEIFGPESATLLAVTNAATLQERLQPVGGEPLWSATWVEKFRRAGEVPAFQAAQNEEAIEGLFRPMLKTANRLGLISDRGLAMAYDRVVTRGLGGGLRWLVQAAGVLRTAAQRQHALQMLGYENLMQFQAAAGDIPQNGIFGPETHAALIAALRQQGAATLPSPEELVCRLVAVAQGVAKKRLMRLRDSSNLTDVIYNAG